MKPIITALVLFISFHLAVLSQENFKVIKVNGTIVLKTKGVSLETGTVFSEKEDLLFRTDDATAAVINSSRGRMILTSRNHDLSAAGSNYMPAMYNISSRAVAPVVISDVKSHFSGRYVVLEKQTILINSSKYPMNNTNFFFLRYMYKGESKNKKLSFSGDTLFLEKKNLFTVDGKPIPSPDNSSIEIYYMKASGYELINKFDLISPDLNQLKKETGIILEEIQAKPYNEKLKEINSYIFDMYGKVSQDDLTGWLEKNFALKPE